MNDSRIIDTDVSNAYLTPIALYRHNKRTYRKYQNVGVFTASNNGLAWQRHQENILDRVECDPSEINYRMHNLRRKILRAQPRGHAFMIIAQRELAQATKRLEKLRLNGVSS